MTPQELWHCKLCLRIFNPGPKDIEIGESVRVNMSKEWFCRECEAAITRGVIDK